MQEVWTVICLKKYSRPLESLSNLSKSDQKAKNFRLILWYFEDQLKVRYHDFVVAVEKLCHDTVEATRTHAIRTIFELLSARPEQEPFLLSSLVNKLGDKSYKVASKVCNILAKLVEKHPNMRSIVVKEVERLIYRPNVSQRAQFYGLCFLSQIMLNSGETELAIQLLDIYFGIFRILIKKGEIDNRMLTVLLGGTNRAFPYAKGKTDQLLKEIDTLYRVVAVSQFGTSLQTLMLLYQVLESSEGVSDRYYCALYKKIDDPCLSGSSRLSLLFNLLYKTLHGDAVDVRVKAFIKRLLQLSFIHTPSFACATLMLTSQIITERRNILRLNKGAESGDLIDSKLNVDDDEEHFEDVVDGDQSPEITTNTITKEKKSSWVHRNNIQGHNPSQTYDPLHRNPLFAAADTTIEYELILLASHYHPSVALFAKTILNQHPIHYDGDPLQDFSTMRFLDRFVYRNPKIINHSKKEEERKNSRKILGRKKVYDSYGVKKLSVNSEEYMIKDEKEIPVDEKFMYHYMTNIGPHTNKVKEEDLSDAESVDSDLFEKVLEKLCHDTVEATRTHAIRTIFELLSARPEQEPFLLSSLVNKLGDKSYKVASKVCNILAKLVEKHPNMRSIVVKEVERLIYRPNVSQRAQFYGLCFLSQIMLNSGETELAIQLLDIYFGIFRILIKKGEIDNRMLTVLLGGTNRAFPYAKGKTDQLLKEIDTLYRVVAVSQFGTSLQTLMLLYQVLESSEGVSDRYYCALYKKIDDPCLSGSSRLSLLFNLLYKTLHGDAVDVRVKAFIKRLLQLSFIHTPSFACATLMLTSQIITERRNILRLNKGAESGDLIDSKLNVDDDEEHFEDVVDGDQSPEITTNTITKEKKSSWVHRNNIQGHNPSQTYDPLHRNPLFAAADTTIEYELILLASHYHPSVALFAKTILNQHPIHYDGDPLQDFSTMRFLDRFVYRNPKIINHSKKEEERKNSRKILGRKKVYDSYGVKKLSVNSEEYMIKDEKEIPVDEKFMYHYMTNIGPHTNKVKEEDLSDAESVDSDLFEKVLEQFEPGGKNEEFDVDFAVDLPSTKPNKKRKRLPVDEDLSESDESDDERLKKKKKKYKQQDVLASAEQFAELMEDAAEREKIKKRTKRPKGYRKHK